MKLLLPISKSFRYFLLFHCFLFTNYYLKAQSPGNVSTSLELWLKANAGTTVSGVDVTTWTDQATGDGSDDMTQATTGNQPDLITNSLNFNSVIDFDGTDDWLDGSAVLTANDDSFTYLAVWESDATITSTVFEQNSNSVVAGERAGLLTINDGTFSYNNENVNLNPQTYAINTAVISTIFLDATTTANIYKNGASGTGTINLTTQNVGTGAFAVGRKHPNTSEYFNGTIAEVIVYSVNLAASDRQKIESYLAIKYGITIDQTSATNYLASDAGIVWDGTTNATYNTDIAGIGRDDNSALDQQKSASVNLNAVLTIANGDITTPVAFTVDDSWLVWGSDNGATTFGSGNINNSDGTTSNRMTRIWKVDETGTVGNVEISFSNGLATGTVSIVIDPSDNTFANNADRRIIEMVDSGSDYEVTVDFKDGDLFSFVNASASVISTKSVLINEVITEPQQDWSSGNFYNSAPGGTAVDGTDEWVELYIATDGLDLTSWTIELLDGTDVTGNLTSTGAFDVSNYLSTSGGTFLSTKIGDYLILGNVDLSGAMNNTGLTVNLKNASGLIIDQAVIGGAGTAPSGNSSGTTDESVSRIPSGTDTNVNSVDFSLTRATLGTTNSPSGTVKINEVVTDPFTDWSTNSFDGTDGAMTVSEVDEWIELYIGSDGINLTGWTLVISGFSGDLTNTGAFDVSNYLTSGGGTFINTVTGDYLVLGNPDGANSMGDSDLIILSDASGTEIDRVQLGGGASQAPSGANSSASAESIVRYTNTADTDADDVDFIQTISTLGSTNSLSGTVLINEVVTDPQQDWSSNGFDGTVAGGTVDTDDEWVELYIGTAGINLTNWTIALTDGTDVSGNLTSTGAFDVSNYISNTAGSSFLSTAVGDYLVLGNVDLAGTMDDDILITLTDATGTTIDVVELGDDPAGDGAGDGAPDGTANGGLATGTSDESVSRIPNATDTGNDVSDFSAVAASLGASNAVASLPGIGNGLDFDGTNDYVDIGDLALTSGTVSMWINADDVIDDRRIYSQLTGLTTQAGPLGIDPNNLDDFGIFVWSGAAWLELVNVGSDWSAQWHHLSVVYSAGSATAYWDGLQQMTQTTNFDFNGVSFGIGAQYTGNGTTFNGQIDELRIWNDVRTHEEILENMFSTLDGSEANLSAYYNFDQSSGTSLPDITSNNNDGTLTNMLGTEWTAAGWNTYSQNTAIFQSGGTDVSTGTSGELTLTDIAFLIDNNDVLLIGHENSDFNEVTTDLPTGTLLTARYNRNWHITKNDVVGTANGNVTLSFNLGSTPSSDNTYYLLERTGTSGNFAIVPVIGISPSGTSVVFTVGTLQIDDGSYYTIGRSDSGVGNSLDFDGTNDYVSISSPPLTATDNLTLEAWVFPDAFSGTTYAAYNGTIATDGYGISFDASGNIGITTGNDGTPVVSATALSTATWSHIAAIRNAGTWQLFVNGVEVSITFSQLPDVPTAGGAIGSDDLGAQLFNGQIDEVRFWSEARTQSQLVANMFSNLAGDEANLAAYYRFNQGIGNSDANLPDLSGDNNNGTLTNFANLSGSTTPSNYLAATRTTFSNSALIVNGGTLTAASGELTLTSTQTAGDFLQDAGDQIIWGNDGGAFTETTSDIPASSLVTNRITKTWNIDKNDVVGTANGNITFSFNLGATPTTDYTYYLLSRTGTSGNFSVVEIIDSNPNVNNIEFTVDGAQITDGNYFTLGRSDSGAGNTVDLDGTDDYVLVVDATVLDITGTLTLEAWINLGTTPPSASEGIVSKFLTAGNQESYTLDINTSGNVVFNISNDGSANTTLTSSSTISTSTWTHIAAVYTPSTSMELYINGILDNSSSTSIPASIFSSSADLWLGASSVINANNQIDASIDEVRVWNIARTKAQIQDDVYNNLAGDETGLVAYYRFNQGDAGNTNTGLDIVPDRSGNGVSGTLTSLALSGASSNWLGSGALVVDENSSLALAGPGNALDFDGTDDYVLITDAAALDITGTLTLEAWINLTTTPPSANEGIVAKHLTATNQESYTLDVNTTGNVEFIISNDGSANTTLASTSTLSTATWTHIAAVYSPSTSMQLYINGVLDNESTTSIPASIFSGTADLWIGVSSVLNAANSINATIDEVRIWNTARSAVEIQDNMFVELTGSETGLVAYYQFDELTNSTSLPDESTNSNTGTLTNMVAASDWIDAFAREPFKTTGAGNWNLAGTWKSGSIPDASTAILNIVDDITLDANLAADMINVNTGVTVTLNASQTLTISGDLINNGTITGAGTISFAGSAAQNLSGGTYSNLTLNNTVSDITLDGNATLTGMLTLTNGNVVLGTNSLTINSGGSISGGGASSYVQTINQNSSGGALQMEVASGAGSVNFPIGTSTYTPFSMINLGTTGNFTLRVFDGTYANGTSGTLHATNTEIDRTWDVTALGSGYNTTITIQWNSGDEKSVSFTRASMFLSLNNSNGDWNNITGTISASGTNPWTASASGLTSFSQIGGGSGSSPLPVSLLNFTASATEGGVMLNWETAAEINSKKFEIEHSVDGLNFAAIHSTKGAGNSDESVSYQYMDSDAIIGVNYYRLKQMDFDGAFEYFPTLVISYRPLANVFIIYPNPFSEKITVQLNPSVEGDLKMALYNMAGKKLYEIAKNQVSGNQVIEGLILPNGIYFLELILNGRQFRTKIIKGHL